MCNAMQAFSLARFVFWIQTGEFEPIIAFNETALAEGLRIGSSVYRPTHSDKEMASRLIARPQGLQPVLTSVPIHYLFCDRQLQMCCFLRTSTTARATLR
jgi:hypothetical protein